MKKFQTKVVEKIKTHIFCTTIFLNRAVYETMWKNFAERSSPEMTIWRMRILCWITTDKHTLRICTIYCFSNTTMVARTRLNVTFLRTLPLWLYIEIN